VSENQKKWVSWLVMVVAGALLAKLLGMPAPAPVPPPNVPFFGGVPVVSFGWNGPEGEETALAAHPVDEFSATPAGQRAFGPLPAEAYLWKSVEKCWSAWPLKDSRPYPQENQSDVGMCVGTGGKHAADASLACEILFHGGQPSKWEPLSAEAIYAAGRDVGGDRSRSDGSFGPWSNKAMIERGFAPMRKYPSVDLTRFDRYRARAWAGPGPGIPADVKAVMERHKAVTCARIRTYDELVTALAQGYGSHICSSVGFEGKKDADGFIRPSGTWFHCMAITGYQSGRAGVLVQNSWDGKYFHVGPAGAGSPPTCSFWVAKSDVERWLERRDTYCYAVSGIQGFEPRAPGKIDWLIRRPVHPQARPVSILLRGLQCELSL
jgi:hypothetical protein